jgi:hypothetical protein
LLATNTLAYYATDFIIADLLNNAIKKIWNKYTYSFVQARPYEGYGMNSLAYKRVI